MNLANPQSLPASLPSTATTLLPSTPSRLTPWTSSLPRSVTSPTEIRPQADFRSPPFSPTPFSTPHLKSRIHTPPFQQQSIRAGLADANRVLGSSASEAEKAEARIEVEVFEGLQAALAK